VFKNVIEHLVTRYVQIRILLGFIDNAERGRAAPVTRFINSTYRRLP
jgi:hypothetical protein